MDLVKLLLAAGVEPNAQKSGGWTALDLATECGDEEMVEVLVSYGANKLMRGHEEMWRERGWRSKVIRSTEINRIDEIIEEKKEKEEEGHQDCMDEERLNERMRREVANHSPGEEFREEITPNREINLIVEPKKDQINNKHNKQEPSGGGMSSREKGIRRKKEREYDE